MAQATLLCPVAWDLQGLGRHHMWGGEGASQAGLPPPGTLSALSSAVPGSKGRRSCLPGPVCGQMRSHLRGWGS